jgi:hypothetical protein
MMPKGGKRSQRLRLWWSLPLIGSRCVGRAARLVVTITISKSATIVSSVTPTRVIPEPWLRGRRTSSLEGSSRPARAGFVLARAPFLQLSTRSPRTHKQAVDSHACCCFEDHAPSSGAVSCFHTWDLRTRMREASETCQPLRPAPV